jgi:DNA-binding NarL/FixJ family response regulator
MSKAPEDTTILLVEDHLALRKGMELLLRARGFHVVGVTDSAEQGYRLFDARRPEVAVIDVALGDGSGVALAARILQLDPDAGVLVYTGITDRESLESAVRSGARGFALKAGGPAELASAITTVASGGVHMDPTIAALLAPSGAPVRLLTARERQILQLLATGMTGEQVAERLVVSPETVRTHIRNTMRKLDAKTRAHAIAIGLRLGEISL